MINKQDKLICISPSGLGVDFRCRKTQDHMRYQRKVDPRGKSIASTNIRKMKTYICDKLSRDIGRDIQTTGQ